MSLSKKNKLNRTRESDLLVKALLKSLASQPDRPHKDSNYGNSQRSS